MEDWLATFARELRGPEGAQQRLDPVRSDKNDVLDLARIVAHGTERKNAPLATFIAGRYVGVRLAEGASLQEALQEVMEVAHRMLPEES